MSSPRFQKLVTSTDELTALIGTPGELVIKKQLAALDEHMRAFVAGAPFLLLGTYGRDGTCDVSPRGDLPAVATVLDPQTLVIPDRPGNRRADSLHNILETGRVGLLLLAPGRGETLRINGRACIVRDDELLAPLAVQGKQPLLGIGVEVEECYFQCAKALLRSQLWNPPAAPPRDATPLHFAEILIEQTGVTSQSAEALAAQIEASYRERLY